MNHRNRCYTNRELMKEIWKMLPQMPQVLRYDTKAVPEANTLAVGT